MYVDPPSTTVNVGNDFSVNVSVANVMDLGGWEFKLYFGNNVLSVASATEGPFLKQGGSTAFFIVDFTNNYNATHGRIWLTSVLVGGVPGVSGNGTLATITFHASTGGNTTLNLVDTVLGDSHANAIPHTTSDGTVRATGVIDIAITDVIPLKTVVGQGYSMNMTVTVGNQGDQPATFDVTTYANTTTTQTKTLTLPNGNSTTETFTWNTTGFVKGNYTISAYAWPVPGETDTADNTLADGVVYVGIPGDVDANHKVEIKDIFAIAKAYGSSVGQPKYNPNLDINNDGKIDIKDIFITAKNYGKTDP